jgi:hypothetical protein
MKPAAAFSPDRVYRYALWRTWDDTKPKVMFVGLNPSTADETNNDNTVNACVRHATNWGYGGFVIGNLFAFCDTDQKFIWQVPNPIGPENDAWLKRLAKQSDKIIAAWSNDGWRDKRGEIVCKMFPEIYCLRRNKSGEPHHPLYIKTPSQPVKYIRN